MSRSGPAGSTSVADRLRSTLPGVELTDRVLDRLAYAHDASHYLLHPQAVARPRTTAAVAEIMRACGRLGVPLTFRGGGTSLSGQALSDSLLVDTRLHFGGVEVLDGGARVRVQPGITVRAVNARLAPYRRKLGPDPASEGACTLGGVIADNSSGMQCGTEQNTYRTLESMVFVLPSGTVVDTALFDADATLRHHEPGLHAGLLALREKVRGDPGAVSTIERLFAIKNTMGYGVNAFLDFESPSDILSHLMIGSEGTLGFVASAVFRTVEVWPDAATGLVFFDGLQSAAEAVPAVAAAGPATAELLDAVSLQVAQHDPHCPTVITGLDQARLAAGGYAALLVEWQAPDPEALAQKRTEAERELAALPLIAAAELTTVTAGRAALWHTRKGLYSTVAWARPTGTSALLEDVAVPVAQLGQLSRGLVELFGAHRYDNSVIFGHARDGNLHFMLTERFGDPPSMARYEAFTQEMVNLVLGLGGTLKAEHGTGRIMAPFVERQYGPLLTQVMREIKTLVDPGGILNPGSVLTDDPRAYLNDLKTAPTVEAEVDRCVECGFCEPVCPSRTLTTTPRQRIALRREREAAGQRGDTATVAALDADFDYDGVQTCAVDGMCASACPVLINTGDLTRRLRAETSGKVANTVWATAAGHWSVASRAGAAALTVAAKAPALPAVLSRWGRTVLSPDVLPRYSADLPAGGRARPRLDPAAPAAVLFPACVGTMFGGGVTVALQRLCARAGIELRTPVEPDALCCGTPWKSKGHLEGYRRMAERVRPTLEEATEGGRLPVIVDASSCAEGLKTLMADRPVHVRDALDFVAEVVAPAFLLTRPVNSVIVHPTCSSTGIGSTDALLTLARMVSSDVVVPVDWGCCAFAGDRGMLHPELTAAATTAEAAEVEALTRSRGGDVVFVSSNRTCEIGMQRATGRPYRHILEILDEAGS